MVPWQKTTRSNQNPARISLDLTRSHRIGEDLARSNEISPHPVRSCPTPIKRRDLERRDLKRRDLKRRANAEMWNPKQTPRSGTPIKRQDLKPRDLKRRANAEISNAEQTPSKRRANTERRENLESCRGPVTMKEGERAGEVVVTGDRVTEERV